MTKRLRPTIAHLGAWTQLEVCWFVCESSGFSFTAGLRGRRGTVVPHHRARPLRR
jgi:hypothetical protein